MAYPRVVCEGTGGEPAPNGSAPAFAEIERRVLAYWERDGTYRAVTQRRAGEPGGAGDGREFILYDGPSSPFGTPHFGHLLSGYIKDVIPRYRTMRGDRVRHRFAWDCHIQPIEMEAERLHEVRVKRDIERLGVARFTTTCQESVDRYARSWRPYIEAQARWIDFDDDCRTMRPHYMESVLWAFRRLWSMGLVYRGEQVLPYCCTCVTPLSARETRGDGARGRRRSAELTIGLPLVDGPAAGALALVTVSTPWSLPATDALGVREDADYVVVNGRAGGPLVGRRVVVAESRLAAYADALAVDAPADGQVLRLTGKSLVGSCYIPPFAFMAESAVAHRLLATDAALRDAGTGIVALAPTFDEDDAVVARAAAIPVRAPIDERGVFLAEVPPYRGQHVHRVSAAIIDDLTAATQGTGAGVVSPGTVLVRRVDRERDAPRCWRCGDELIHRAVATWYVRVTAVKERMIELTREISWVPGEAQGQAFTRWLENARDWSISRNRYWGAPVPVWMSDDPAYPRVDVYGSLDELERDFGVRPDNLHRPFVDELTRPNPDDPSGLSTMRRVPEVLSCWFESGSLPFAEVHYPFENVDWFERTPPQALVVEYRAQIRGWFYALHAMSTLLFDRPAVKTCISHGIALDADGGTMSVSTGNSPDVRAILDSEGADALRWFLMSSQVLRGGDVRLSLKDLRDSVGQVLVPLWNVWQFFVTHANAADQRRGYRVRIRGAGDDASTQVLDRFLLAATHDLVRDTGVAMDAHDVSAACGHIRQYVDDMSNWYLRGSRERFAAGDPGALDTLYAALHMLLQVTAPLLPLISEEIWRGLTGARSVHLTDWPDLAKLPADPQLLDDMKVVREVCSATLAIRRANGLRVRQPLAELVVAGADAGRLAPYLRVIEREVNVQRVTTTDLADADRELRPVARTLGPRLGGAVHEVLREARAGRFVDNGDGTVTVAGHVLGEGDFVLRAVAMQPDSVVVDGRWVLTLDTRVTPELDADGWVRDVIRRIMVSRKSAAVRVGDEVRVRLRVPRQRGPVALRDHELIARATLARDLEVVVADVDDVDIVLTPVN